MNYSIGQQGGAVVSTVSSQQEGSGFESDHMCPTFHASNKAHIDCLHWYEMAFRWSFNSVGILEVGILYTH